MIYMFSYVCVALWHFVVLLTNKANQIINGSIVISSEKFQIYFEKAKLEYYSNNI